MKEEALEFWSRALLALETAQHDFPRYLDAAGSRAYYAAFYAVTALFRMEGESFSKHSAVKAAVYRDLVHAGHWSPRLGSDYSSLMELRMVGDYGGFNHISEKNALNAIEAAQRILQAVHQAHPDLFPLPEEKS